MLVPVLRGQPPPPPVLPGQMVECDAYEPLADLDNSLGQDWLTNRDRDTATQLAMDNAMESANAQGLDSESRYNVPCLDTSNDC